MDLVVKIFDRQYTAKAQFINPAIESYEEDLTGYGEMIFSIPLEEMSSILEFDRVALFRFDSNGDRYLWDGYVRRIETDLQNAKIFCGDWKKYLKRKMLFTNKTYSAIAVDSILSEILSESFVRSGEKLWHCKNLQTVVSKEYATGSSYFDVINDLADLLKAEWTCKLGVIYFFSDLADYDAIRASHDICPVWASTGWEKINALYGNFYDFLQDVAMQSEIGATEFRFNYLSPAENSIVSVKTKMDSDDLYTSLIATNTGFTKMKTNNTDIFGHIEHHESVTGNSEAELETQAQSLIDTNSQYFREYEVEIDTRYFDIKNVLLGHNATLIIESKYDFINVNQSFNINKRKVEFLNKEPKITVTLANPKVQIKNIGQIFDSINRRLSLV